MSYATMLQAIRYSGLGVQIVNEIIGEANGSKNNFDFANPNVIDGSYTISYASADSNDLTELTETTHYTIDKDGGFILLTATGLTLTSGKILYASYYHSPKVSRDDLTLYLAAANEEVDKITGTYWGIEKSTTEYHDGEDYSKVSYEDAPYSNYDDNVFAITLENKNITGITSVDFLDKTGASSVSVDLTYVTYYDWGELIFQNMNIPFGKKNIKVVYTHGIATPPALIVELECLIVGIMSYAKITGGSYDDATMFTLGRKSFSIGEVYPNVREAARQFEVRRDYIVRELGSKMDVI